MTSAKTNVTIREVAKKAGVTVATVSRVLNDSGLVVAKTETKIRKIARELNYIPSASARSLSIQKTETISLLLPDMYGDFFSEIIRGADLAARNAKYHLLVSSSHSNTEELDAAVKTLSGRVDGMIIMSPHLESSTHFRSVLEAMPTVILGPTRDLGKANYISIDNVGGARQVLQHLLKRGHTRIAIIRGERDNVDAEERLSGYTDVLKESGIAFSDENIVRGTLQKIPATTRLPGCFDKPFVRRQSWHRMIQWPSARCAGCGKRILEFRMRLQSRDSTTFSYQTTSTLR
jgi:LacI family transcriptional regulator